jgi:glycosyltransferase involved in cell wall biosynthesis
MLENMRKSIPNSEGRLKTTGQVQYVSTAAQPLVSIVTVCLNSEKHLEQTIQSVINQTYDNIEYIIIDGGSTDRTIRIIRKYERNISYWLSEPDKGIYDAMNKGIGMSNGQLVGLLNSDDWYNTKAVEWVVRELLIKPDYDVFHGNDVVVGDRQNEKKTALRSECVSKDLQILVSHPTFFVKKELYLNYKYDCRFKIGADRDFIMRIYFDGKKFCYINRPITYFRTTGISNQTSFKAVLDRYIIRSRYNRGKAILHLTKEIVIFLAELIFLFKKKLKR